MNAFAKKPKTHKTPREVTMSTNMPSMSNGILDLITGFIGEKC